MALIVARWPVSGTDNFSSTLVAPLMSLKISVISSLVKGFASAGRVRFVALRGVSVFFGAAAGFAVFTGFALAAGFAVLVAVLVTMI